MTASRPKIGPLTSATTIRVNSGTGMASIWNSLLPPSAQLLRLAAEMLDIAMGATVRREKCRKMASWAKTIAAMGALNPAAIAPATPQPI